MRKVLFILSELSDSDIDWLIANGVKRTLSTGTVLLTEGVPTDAMFILLEGHLSVSLAAIGGRQASVLRSGEIIGELSFLDSRPPSATVTAADEATVLSISRSDLSGKLASDLGFAARFYRALGVFLASRLRRSERRLGYGTHDVLDETVEHEDELDPELLNQISLAGARFDWMLKRLKNEPSVLEAGGSSPSA